MTTTNSLSNPRPINISIDILKFIAAILITNSHMEILYVDPFKSIATGGSIGNGLFFFCSGFTPPILQRPSFPRRVNLPG